jgi:hypothetical protein
MIRESGCFHVIQKIDIVHVKCAAFCGDIGKSVAQRASGVSRKGIFGKEHQSMADPKWSFVMKVYNAKTAAGEEFDMIFEIDGYANRIIGPYDKLDVLPDGGPFSIGGNNEYIAQNGVLSIKKQSAQGVTSALLSLYKDKTKFMCTLAVVPFRPHKHVPLLTYWRRGVEAFVIIEAHIFFMIPLFPLDVKHALYYDFDTFKFDPNNARLSLRE